MFDQAFEKSLISFFCLTSCLVGKIFLKLFDVGRHILRIRHPFVFRITINLNNVLHETDQGLGVHCHMVYQEIDPIKSIRHMDHDNPVHRGIVPLERHRRPGFHNVFRLLHRLSREIHKLNLSFFPVHDILIASSLFVLGKPESHGFTSLVSFVDRLPEHFPVKFRSDRKTRPDIQDLFFWAILLIEEMQPLRRSQWVNFVPFPFSHHFIIPPVNKSIAFSYAFVSL